MEVLEGKWCEYSKNANHVHQIGVVVLLENEKKQFVEMHGFKKNFTVFCNINTWIEEG
jgi:hypothetical protein